MTKDMTDMFYLAKGLARTPERAAAVAELGLTDLWEAAIAAADASDASKHEAPASDLEKLMFALPDNATVTAFDDDLAKAAEKAWQAYSLALAAKREEWEATPEGIRASIARGI